MAAIDAVSATVASNSSAMTVANNLHVAGLAIAAYEYVACNFLLTLVLTYRLQFSCHYSFRTPAIQDYKSTEVRKMSP